MEQEKNNNIVKKITTWIGSISSLIIHTIFFALAFVCGGLEILDWDTVLLVLTTLVSLEAIYLAIFIQMTVNDHTVSLQEVEKDIDEIEKDVEEISENVEEIQEEVEDIHEDVEEIQEDVEEIQEDDEKDSERKTKQTVTLDTLSRDIQVLLKEIENLKKRE